MIIKKLQLSDLDALCILEQVCFAKPWTREALAEELVHPDALNLGLFPSQQGGEGLGVRAALLTRLVANERWIFRIMTHPDLRRRGLAEAMLGDGEFWLEVSVENTGAIRFYEQVGFQVVAKRPGYYPEDALVMHRSAHA